MVCVSRASKNKKKKTCFKTCAIAYQSVLIVHVPFGVLVGTPRLWLLLFLRRVQKPKCGCVLYP